MAIREGAWDCPQCGKERNRGPQKFCGGCGAARGAGVKFYLPDDAREVTDETELKRAQAGPDWNCSFCGGDNPGENPFCGGCGAAREGMASRQVRETRFSPAGNGPAVLPGPGSPASPGLPPVPVILPPVPGQNLPGPETAIGAVAAPPVTAGGARSLSAPATPGPVPPAGPIPPAGSVKPARVKKGCCLGAAVAAVLLLVLGFCLFRSRPADLTVKGFAWERTVEVENLRTVTDKAWEGELPAGARVKSQQREIHHHNKVQTGSRTATRTVTHQEKVGTERVKVGTRDLGNGYFEDIYEDRPVYEDREREETYQEPVYREDPVYRTRFTYEIDRWEVSRTEKASGADHQARWPGVPDGPKVRPGKRTEKYRVFFTGGKGKSYTYETKTEAEWLQFQPGKRYKAEVNPFGEAVRKISPTPIRAER